MSLYAVKHAAEQVRLAFIPEQQRIDLHLEFARQRLRELQVLADRGEVSEDRLAEISNETKVVLEQAAALPQDGKRTVLASLTDLEDQNLQVLKRMASSARGDAQAKVMAALADSTTRRQLVMQLLAGAASDSTPGGLSGEPPAILKEETRPAHGNPTMKPDSVKQPEPPVTSLTTAKASGRISSTVSPAARRLLNSGVLFFNWSSDSAESAGSKEFITLIHHRNKPVDFTFILCADDFFHETEHL